MTDHSDCPFCLENQLLADKPLLANDAFYFLASIDPEVPLAGMVIPRRHSETPFDMDQAEWAAFADMLAQAKAFFASSAPDGFTLGWNVGAVAGQSVFHTHLHILARFKGEPAEGAGIRRILRPQDWLAAP
jgi:histidine triad (HIT) family protein